MKGWLVRTDRSNTQRRAYFVLEGRLLTWFNKPEASSSAYVPLFFCFSLFDAPFLFSPHRQGTKQGQLDASVATFRGLGMLYFELVSGSSRQILSGESKEESRSWLEALRGAANVQTAATSRAITMPVATPPARAPRASPRTSGQDRLAASEPGIQMASTRSSAGTSSGWRSPRMSLNLASAGASPVNSRSPRLSMFGKSPRGSTDASPRLSPRLTGSRVKSGAYRPVAPPVSVMGEHYGWMSKKNKDRWFLLREHVLYWFMKEQPLDVDIRKEVRGSLSLEGCTVADMQQESFSISAPGGAQYLLVCQTPRERDDWVHAIGESLKSLAVLVENNGIRSGWLEKKKQRRWFVLQDASLAWYAKEGDARERGQLSMADCTVAIDDSKTFTLVSSKDDQLRYQLVAKTSEEAAGWVRALQRAAERGKAKEEEILRARAMARQNAAARQGGQVNLEKRGWFVKKRKRRFYVLHNTVLMWYANEADSAASQAMKGTLNMMECAVTTRGFDLHIRTKEGELYVLTAPRKSEVDDWASAIKDSCNAARVSVGGASNASGGIQNLGVSSGFGNNLGASGGGGGAPQPKRGWATKKGKRRYLVLRTGELLYFDREQSGFGDAYTDKPKGSILLATAQATEVTPGSFLVRTEGSKEGLVFETPEASGWVVAICAFVALSVADSGLSHSGWMVKKGKRRWFALRRGTLMWFNDVQASVQEDGANGTLLLKRCRIVDDVKARTILITPHAETGEKPLEISCYNAGDMTAWMSALKGGQAAASQTTMIDPFASSGKGLVFGRPIEEVLQREGTLVPNIVTSCCEFLRETALEHSGLFRLSGASNTINKLRDAFDAGDVVDFLAGDDDEVEIDVVAGLLKLYIRQLPEPPLSFDLYTRFLDAADNVDELANLVQLLPDANYDFCVYMMDFLGEIASLSDRNQMTPSNIAIVMGPNFLRQRDGEGDLVSGLRETPVMLKVFGNLVANHETVFPK